MKVNLYHNNSKVFIFPNKRIIVLLSRKNLSFKKYYIFLQLQPIDGFLSDVIWRTFLDSVFAIFLSARNVRSFKKLQE